MNEKGVTPVLMLLITAVAVAVSTVVGQNVIELTEKTLPKESVPIYVTQSNGKVEIVNPSYVAADLSKLKVIVNNNETLLSDENNNGIWEPGEKLSFSLQTIENIITVEVLYDGQTVYKSTYIKPIELYSDREFPTITYSNEFDVDVDDDTAILTINVFAGTDKGEVLLSSFTPFGDIDMIKQCFREYERTNVWNCSQFSKTSLSIQIEKLDVGKRVEVLHNGDTDSLEGNITFLRVTAYDVSGKPSSLVLINDSPPKVEIIEPIDGSSYATTSTVTVPISAEAKDDYGIIAIDIYVDGTRIATCNSDSCTTSAQLGIGTHEIRAVATDTTGQTSGDKVTVFVTGDNPPSIYIVQPKDGDTFEATEGSYTVNIVANANDDIGINRVEFYIDSTKIFTDYNPPYECSATLSLGTHEIRAVAVDTAGQTAEDVVSVSVQGNTPPQITLSLSDGGEVS